MLKRFESCSMDIALWLRKAYKHVEHHVVSPWLRPYPTPFNVLSLTVALDRAAKGRDLAEQIDLTRLF